MLLQVLVCCELRDANWAPAGACNQQVRACVFVCMHVRVLLLVHLNLGCPLCSCWGRQLGMVEMAGLGCCTSRPGLRRAPTGRAHTPPLPPTRFSSRTCSHHAFQQVGHLGQPAEHGRVPHGARKPARSIDPSSEGDACTSPSY